MALEPDKQRPLFRAVVCVAALATVVAAFVLGWRMLPPRVGLDPWHAFVRSALLGIVFAGAAASMLRRQGLDDWRFLVRGWLMLILVAILGLAMSGLVLLLVLLWIGTVVPGGGVQVFTPRIAAACATFTAPLIILCSPWKWRATSALLVLLRLPPYVPTGSRPDTRDAARRRRGECPACGYSLKGVRVSVCPECGAIRRLAKRG